ncbi:Hachiman antiphage defense system protein HamA, partial [Acidithiobacillus sp.]|uniref:Hachiman antiphage defense system protein HamA n=1 Tax=Acidithiobacillus sp. TaxID=1872118 RepID=UPI003CFE0A02
SIEDARLDSIVASVKASLSPDKLKKENSIITNVSDIDRLEIDSGVCNRIKSALSHTASIDTIKPLINVPILILHECEITAAASELSESYKDSIRKYHTQRAVAYFKKQLTSIGEMHKYGEIKFHLLLFPVPIKKPIVDMFVTGVKYYKGDS